MSSRNFRHALGLVLLLSPLIGVSIAAFGVERVLIAAAVVGASVLWVYVSICLLLS